MKKTLQLEWTNKVEIIKDGSFSEYLSVYEGIDQDGKHIRVYVKRIEDIEEKDD